MFRILCVVNIAVTAGPFLSHIRRQARRTMYTACGSPELIWKVWTKHHQFSDLICSIDSIDWFCCSSSICLATITVPADNQWFKLNRDQIGFYRVNYDVDEWQRLSAALISNHSQFTISDRGHLLNDAFSLASASQLSYDIALNLTPFLKSETEYVPWSVALGALSGLRSILYHSEHYPSFVVWINK